MLGALAARWRKIAPRATPALVWALIVLAMFWRLWTPIAGARHTFTLDAQWCYWGNLQFQLDAYRAGHFPLWNPFDRGGYPFFADPQPGVLYPVNWLIVAIGLLFHTNAWWLTALYICIHFWLAGLGMYVFLRRRGLPIAACYAGGLIFILTYPFIHNLFSALNWSMAWTPWALLAVDAWAERPSAGRAALVAVAIAMGELAGALAGFWYGLLVIVPYGTWALIHHARAAGPQGRGAYLRAAATTTAVAVGVFALIIGAQLDATRRMLPYTVREGRDIYFITDTAFGPDDLLGFACPRLPGENCYIGFATILWVAATVSLRPSARTFVLSGVALLGILCAFGNFTPVLPLGASLAPPFSFFRRAHRYLYTTVTALAILGAEGLAQLYELQVAETRARVSRMVVGAAALAVLVFGIGFVVKATDPQKVEPYRDAFALAVASAIVGAWVTRQVILVGDARWRRAFLVLATLVIGLDLVASRAFVIERNMTPPPQTPHDGELAALPGLDAEWRIYDREYFKYRPGLRLHLRDFGGYEDDPLDLTRYRTLLEASWTQQQLLGHANVRYLYEEGRKVSGKSAAAQKILRPLHKDAWEVTDVAPAAFWVGRATIVDGDAGEALAALTRARPGSVAILERGMLEGDEAGRAQAGDAAAPPVAGRIVEHDLSRVVAEVDAPSAGVVVIQEAWYPGWQATVDGSPARVLPANLMFRGVLVGPGNHRIELRFHAARYLALIPLELLGLALVAALVLVERRRERRKASTETPGEGLD